MTKQKNLDDDFIVIDLNELKSESEIASSGWHTDIVLGSSTLTDINSYSGIYVSAGASGTAVGPSWHFDEVSLSAPYPSKIKLDGDDADIEINGRSVMQILDSIEQRLGLLKCREDLEQEWEELRVLGNQYRELQSKIEEKARMWDTLKKMPKPNIK